MEQRHSAQINKVRELLEQFDTAMLVTHASGEPHHARPMAIAHIDDDCDVWFFTDRGSPKVNEIEHDERVLIVCQDEHARYLSIMGRAQLIQDEAKANEYWKETFKPWFPGGVNDPGLLLIHVHAENAEYWDSQGSKGIKYIFQAATAYATGTRPKIEEGKQHGKITL
ncbi:MAG: ral stress protein [Verrucomicrobiales bacterium]|nr:ral stress protein [Verrucomicrobiales bacterium]